mgnify:CR=1 FL=1
MARGRSSPSADSNDPRWQASPRAPAGGGGRPAPGVRPFRVTPLGATLAVALVGSLAFMAYAVTVRDELQVPLIASGAAVLGLVFAALAITGAMATLRAAREENGRAAMLRALAGGIAAMIACGAFAAATIFGLLWRPGA